MPILRTCLRTSAVGASERTHAPPADLSSLRERDRRILMNSMTLNASDWVLTQFTRQTAMSKKLALVIVVAIILSIALADYFSEIRVSLTVFYFVPILLAVGWLGARAAIGVAVASILFKIFGDLVEAADHSLPLWGWWNAGSTLL